MGAHFVIAVIAQGVRRLRSVIDPCGDGGGAIGALEFT